MAKKTNEEEVKTLSAEETAEEVNDTENNGATITLDDDSGVRPLAADDYVENFEVGGKTYAVRDAEAQDSITQLNSELTSVSISDVISDRNGINLSVYKSGFVYIKFLGQYSAGDTVIGTITDSKYIPDGITPGYMCILRNDDATNRINCYINSDGEIIVSCQYDMAGSNRGAIIYPV